MNNQLNTNNSLAYKGCVDIFIQKKNNKQIHVATLNSGLQGISELFTRIVLNYPTDDYIPWYIDLQNSGESSILYNPAEIRARSYGIIKNDSSYLGWKYPVFDALIKTEDIQSDVESGKYYLVLLSHNYTPLARVEIGVDISTLTSRQDNPNDIPVLGLRSGNNILIRWSMQLSNMQKEN